MKRKIDAVQINPLDNVAVATTAINAGTTVKVKGDNGESAVISLDDVPFGHKIALADITKGGFIHKYGAVIGVALKDIGKGERVDHGNIAGLRGKLPSGDA